MIGEAKYWLFLLALVVVYWVIPLRFRTWLLALSCAGYLLFMDPSTVLAMLVFAVACYGVFTRVEPGPGRRTATTALIVGLLLYLGYFKYFPVIGSALNDSVQPSSILIPLGISYFTFKLIHYCIESSRGHLPPHGPQDVLAYIFLVPIFTAGPIERFDHFVNQRQIATWRPEFVTEGLTRIAHGLVKRFLIGAIILTFLGRVTQQGGAEFLLNNLEDISSFRVIAFLIFTYLYVYMDFAGYTDIAIGTSRLFGLRIMENFNLPIFAPNIGNLWKRWHMTLAGWCQSYVYMPMLGWTRNPYIAVVSSFLVMGLWHAASLNWIAWGLYNAAGVCFYQTWLVIERRRKWKFMKRRPFNWIGIPATFVFFAGSFAFTTTDNVAGLYGAVRLLAKCFFITLPG